MWGKAEEECWYLALILTIVVDETLLLRLKQRFQQGRRQFSSGSMVY